MFAWLLVSAGAAITVLTIPLVNASNQTAFTAHLEYCKNILSMNCLNSPAAESGYAPGFIAGAVVACFGVLLLAIRRPTPLSKEAQEQEREMEELSIAEQERKWSLAEQERKRIKRERKLASLKDKIERFKRERELTHPHPPREKKTK